jgi:hypothetical protein
MRFSTLSALCALIIPFVAAVDDSAEKNLKIEKINQVDCSRPSKKNDRLKVHYHGALLDGKLLASIPSETLFTFTTPFSGYERSRR